MTTRTIEVAGVCVTLEADDEAWMLIDQQCWQPFQAFVTAAICQPHLRLTVQLDRTPTVMMPNAIQLERVILQDERLEARSRQTWRGWVDFVSGEAELIVRKEDLYGGIQNLLRMVWQYWLSRGELSGTIFHGASFRIGNRAFIATGDPDAGKSTLAKTLVEADVEVWGDDHAVVRIGEDGRIWVDSNPFLGPWPHMPPAASAPLGGILWLPMVRQKNSGWRQVSSADATTRLLRQMGYPALSASAAHHLAASLAQHGFSELHYKLGEPVAEMIRVWASQPRGFVFQQSAVTQAAVGEPRVNPLFPGTVVGRVESNGLLVGAGHKLLITDLRNSRQIIIESGFFGLRRPQIQIWELVRRGLSLREIVAFMGKNYRILGVPFPEEAIVRFLQECATQGWILREGGSA